MMDMVEHTGEVPRIPRSQRDWMELYSLIFCVEGVHLAQSTSDLEGAEELLWSAMVMCPNDPLPRLALATLYTKINPASAMSLCDATPMIGVSPSSNPSLPLTLAVKEAAAATVGDCYKATLSSIAIQNAQPWSADVESMTSLWGAIHVRCAKKEIFQSQREGSTSGVTICGVHFDVRVNGHYKYRTEDEVFECHRGGYPSYWLCWDDELQVWTLCMEPSGAHCKMQLLIQKREIFSVAICGEEAEEKIEILQTVRSCHEDEDPINDELPLGLPRPTVCVKAGVVIREITPQIVIQGCDDVSFTAQMPFAGDGLSKILIVAACSELAHNTEILAHDLVYADARKGHTLPVPFTQLTSIYNKSFKGRFPKDTYCGAHLLFFSADGYSFQRQEGVEIIVEVFNPDTHEFTHIQYENRMKEGDHWVECDFAKHSIHPYTNETWDVSKDEVIPTGWEWLSSWTLEVSNSTDEEGWEYSCYTNDPIYYHPHCAQIDTFKRRKWARKRRCKYNVDITHNSYAHLLSKVHAFRCEWLEHLPKTVEEKYENERWYPLKEWSKSLIPTDRYQISSECGRIDHSFTEAPAGWQWVGDWEVSLTGADCHGWTYSTDFPNWALWRSIPDRTDVVRRRRYTRQRVQLSPRLKLDSFTGGDWAIGSVPSSEMCVGAFGELSDAFYYKIVHHSEKVLEVEKSSIENYGNIRVAPLEFEPQKDLMPNQQWRLKTTRGGCLFLVAKHSRMAASVNARETQANVAQARLQHKISQRWKLIPAYDGYYYIVNRYSSKFLTIVDPMYGAGAINVVQSTLDPAPHFLWKFVEVGPISAASVTNLNPTTRIDHIERRSFMFSAEKAEACSSPRSQIKLLEPAPATAEVFAHRTYSLATAIVERSLTPQRLSLFPDFMVAQCLEAILMTCENDIELYGMKALLQYLFDRASNGSSELRAKWAWLELSGYKLDSIRFMPKIRSVLTVKCIRCGNIVHEVRCAHCGAEKDMSTVVFSPSNYKSSQFFQNVYNNSTVFMGKKVPVNFDHPLYPGRHVTHAKVIKVFSSAARPILIELSDEISKTSSKMIFKTGDDVSKDELVMMYFGIFNDIWNKRQLTYNDDPVRALQYRVACSGVKAGMIEVVPGVSFQSTRDRVQFSPRLVATAAGAMVAGHILGICDRHKSNMMIQEDGTFFHIDFGRILRDYTKIDAEPLAIPSEFKDIMKDEYSAFEELCVKAYGMLHEEREFLNNLLELVYPHNMNLGRSLGFHMSPSDFYRHVKDSPNLFSTQLKNFVHDRGF